MAERVALVTGASRGLGAALAEELAARGWHVVAVARTTGALEELDDRVKAAALPGALTLAPMDVTQPEAMAHLAGAIAQRWGGLGLWAHCAIHDAPLMPAAATDHKEWDKSIALNLRAAAHLVTLTEPLLRAHGGTALFFADPRGGEKFFSVYGATKAAQIALARSWQAETSQTGPRVEIAAPRPMPTALRARFYPGESRDGLSAPRDEARRILSQILSA